MSKYVVMTSSGNNVGKYGNYRKVAVLEVEDDAKPKMISERAIGVIRIVKHFGNVHVGKTEKCSYRLALQEANELVRKLTERMEGKQ